MGLFGKKSVGKKGKSAQEGPARRYSTESMRASFLSQKDAVIHKQAEQVKREIARLPKVDIAALEYFRKAADIYGSRLTELKEFKKKGGKVVGQLCVLAPSEPIWALGAVPVRICSGESECAQRAQDLVGDAGLCPLAKAVIGGTLSQSSQYITLCDLIAAPTPCDAKLKAGEILADSIPVVSMSTPRTKDDASRKAWAHEVQKLVRAVEKLTGKELTAKALGRAVNDYQNAQAAWRRLYDLRMQGNVLWGRDALLVGELTFVDDIVRWTKNVHALCDELEGRLKDKKTVCPDDAPRILIGGSPIVWPNWKVPHLIEDSGAIIVDDELCTAGRTLANPTVVEEATYSGLLDAVADRYIFPCTCPCFTPNLERGDVILRKVKENRVDGVIFHVLKGCHLNAIDATRIKTLLKEKNIPLLILDSDYGDGDVGQLKIRIEAFLEMVRASKDEVF